MSMLLNDKRWYDAMIANGHTPQLEDDGGIDIMASEDDIHYGPMCTKCYWSCCVRCHTIDQIPVCKESSS